MKMKTRALVLTALGAACSAVLAHMRLELPFPLLPFLKFDLAEIPPLLVCVVLSIKYGIAAELVHFLFLMLKGEFVPIGPIMKLLAVVSTMAGYSLAAYGTKFKSQRTHLRYTVVCIVTACVIRSFVMLCANYVVILFVLPGLAFYSLPVMMFYVFVFNVLHVMLDFALVIPVVQRLSPLMTTLEAE